MRFLESDHNKGSHGIPGLYFKYDVSALKVHVTQDREHVAKFIVRLCSIIAGIIVISGKRNATFVFYLLLIHVLFGAFQGFVNTSLQLNYNYFMGITNTVLSKTATHPAPAALSASVQQHGAPTTTAPINLLFTPAVSGAGFDSDFTPLVKQ